MNKIFNNKIIVSLIIVSIFITSCNQVSTKTPGDTSVYGIFKEGFNDAEKRAIYVLGPPIGPGWNGQIGRFASERVKEINNSDDYFAIYLEVATMSTILDYITKEINDNKEKIGGFVLAPGDLDFDPIYLKLYSMNIPYAIFNDRSDSDNKKHAMVNILEDDEQCGAACAYWMQLRGLNVNTTFAAIYNSEDGRSMAMLNGFKKFLLGELDYIDIRYKEVYHVNNPWTETQVERLFSKFSNNSRMSFENANRFAVSHTLTFANSATRYTGQMLLFSTCDDYSLGFLYGLNKYQHNPDTLATFDNCYFGIASVGGMQEYMTKIDSIRMPLLDLSKRVDDMMTVYSSPNNINYAIDYLIMQLQKYKEETGEDLTSDAIENLEGNEKKYGTAIVDTANYDLFIGYDGGYPSWRVNY